METSYERRAHKSATAVAELGPPTTGNLSSIPPRVDAALVLLWESHAYADDLGRCAWDFAVELFSLRELGLTNSDFRWLVGKGLVDHAREVTSPGEGQRTFRPCDHLALEQETCFVLSDCGLRMAAEVARRSRFPAATLGNGSSAAPLRAVLAPHTADNGHATTSVLTPVWDRDRQELRVGTQIVKQFKLPAVNQVTILAAFEEEHWPPRVDDPLPPGRDSRRRLHDTINSLNRNQRCGLIHFLGDGTGQGVRWEFAERHSA